jgi:hypothetical protein
MYNACQNFDLNNSFNLLFFEKKKLINYNMEDIIKDTSLIEKASDLAQIN